MSELESVSQNLQFLIAPTSEGEFEKLEKLCRCTAKIAQEKWEPAKYSEFSNALSEHAELANSVMENMEEMLENGPPRPSETVISGMQDMVEIIESCEERYGIRVEF
ncbi:hypothetical protein [Pseudoalteromonas sp. J010]|uniref:hypothetical protein n=1 Tax=Pseudoalteromonas sp. J010 TaxID=998465 RepID=UPI000F6481DC|nr:hypothetical protein [Pseudoalteromonas sp. J010]